MIAGYYQANERVKDARYVCEHPVAPERVLMGRCDSQSPPPAWRAIIAQDASSENLTPPRLWACVWSLRGAVGQVTLSYGNSEH